MKVTLAYQPISGRNADFSAHVRDSLRAARWRIIDLSDKVISFEFTGAKVATLPDSSLESGDKDWLLKQQCDGPRYGFQKLAGFKLSLRSIPIPINGNLIKDTLDSLKELADIRMEGPKVINLTNLDKTIKLIKEDIQATVRQTGFDKFYDLIGDMKAASVVSEDKKDVSKNKAKPAPANLPQRPQARKNVEGAHQVQLEEQPEEPYKQPYNPTSKELPFGAAVGADYIYAKINEAARKADRMVSPTRNDTSKVHHQPSKQSLQDILGPDWKADTPFRPPRRADTNTAQPEKHGSPIVRRATEPTSSVKARREAEFESHSKEMKAKGDATEPHDLIQKFRANGGSKSFTIKGKGDITKNGFELWSRTAPAHFAFSVQFIEAYHANMSNSRVDHGAMLEHALSIAKDCSVLPRSAEKHAKLEAAFSFLENTYVYPLNKHIDLSGFRINVLLKKEHSDAGLDGSRPITYSKTISKEELESTTTAVSSRFAQLHYLQKLGEHFKAYVDFRILQAVVTEEAAMFTAESQFKFWFKDVKAVTFPHHQLSGGFHLSLKLSNKKTVETTFSENEVKKWAKPYKLSLVNTEERYKSCLKLLELMRGSELAIYRVKSEYNSSHLKVGRTLDIHYDDEDLITGCELKLYHGQRLIREKECTPQEVGQLYTNLLQRKPAESQEALWYTVLVTLVESLAHN